MQANVQGDPSKNGLATAALVVGIISLLTSFFLGVLAIFPAIVGVVLGIMGRKAANKGQATAGLILSIIAIVFGIIGLFLLGALLMMG